MSRTSHFVPVKGRDPHKADKRHRNQRDRRDAKRWMQKRAEEAEAAQTEKLIAEITRPQPAMKSILTAFEMTQSKTLFALGYAWTDDHGPHEASTVVQAADEESAMKQLLDRHPHVFAAWRIA